ncbi:MAG: antitoxin family protein [Blastocatellia bacterium]
MMMRLEAIYQGGGVLRLLQPLDLPEGERVLLNLAEIPPDDDYLDTEYHRYCEQNADYGVTLDEVRAALSKIQGSMADVIIAEREERF